MASTGEHAYSRGCKRRGKQPRKKKTRGDTNMFHTRRLPLDQIKETRDWWTLLEDVPVHGDELSPKDDSMIRMYFENVDGLGILPRKPVHDNNSKIKYFNALTNRLEVDVICGVETRTNWPLLPKSHQLQNLLQLREGARVITGHNEHERFSQAQQGGTFMAIKEFNQGIVQSVGKDTTGLGRWCWIKLKGATSTTRIIVAYEACRTRKCAQNATIAQQRRYWRIQGDKRCPRRIFREELVNLITEWREEGDKVVLFIDSNENMEQGQLQRMLQKQEIDMKDAIKERSGCIGPSTFVRGSKQIDAVWTTKDIQIRNACFTPFYFGIGDHRGIVIDIPKTSIIGSESKVICRPIARRLRCNQEDIWKRYNDQLESYLRYHNVHKKLDVIKEKDYEKKRLRKTLNAIDKVVTEGMIHAEKKCRKIRAGEVPFSPKLAEVGTKIKLWKLIERHHKGDNINTKYIRRIEKKCGIKGGLSMSLEEVCINKIKVEAKYKKMKKMAYRLRNEFLYEMIELKTSEKAKREIKAIIRHEETRRAWRTINKGRGKVQMKGVSEVKVMQNDEYITITEQDEVENAIMHNNSKRFHLAASTPLMERAAVNSIGYLANTEIANSIVEGNFEPAEQLDEYTKKFLKFIGRRPTLPQFNGRVSAADFIAYWKKAKEKTSSSMSKRHFGHYKAASKNNFLSNIHAKICDTAASNGISIDRWECGLTVMLEKIKGVIKVDKLRAILLMEADFNFINKLMFGNRLMKQCKKYNRFPKELFGGLENKSAQEVGVNRRLVLDLFRIKRRNGAVAGVDATQCYDRIVHSLAILLSRNEGAPINPLLCMFGAIQGMKYFLRTTFGDSERSYGGRQEVPFQGSCQGNGASPAMWLMISMYLVLLAREEKHITSFSSAFSGLTIVLIGFLFVDDTDLVIMGNSDDSVMDVILKMQKAIDFWNGILRVSGGALKPEKCYWYLAQFEWKKGKHKLIHNSPETIKITTEDGRRTVIDYKKPNEATEAVGVWQDMVGSSNKQVEVIVENIRKTHESMNETPLPRHLNWIGLKQAIWKSIDYILPATTFNENDCTRICKELYRPLLPKLGCNRNFPLLLRYNEPSLMGLGLANPYWEQGFSHIDILLTHGGCNTITGRLLSAMIEQHQLEIGMIEHLFELKYEDFKHLTEETWITNTWEFLNKFDIHLINGDTPRIILPRENDITIMKALKQICEITKKEETSFNRVRCHFQLLSIADIATGCGTKICQKYLEGTNDTNSNFDWHKEEPDRNDYKIWRKYLPNLLTNTNQLKFPVGKWIRKSHRQWKWYYCEDTDRIFEKKPNGYIVYIKSMNATRNNMLYITSSGIVPCPEKVIYTTVTVLSPTLIRFEGNITSQTINALSPTTAVPEHSFWMLKESNIIEHSTLKWVKEGLYKETLRAVCDGSFQPKLSTKGISTSWIVETNDQRYNMWGTCCTESTKGDAYRAELLGIYCLLNVVYFIEKSFPEYKKGKLRIGCDNEKAGYKSMEKDVKVSSNHKHMDIIKAIRRLKELLKTTIEVYHIYGHQDENKPFSELERDAQLNVIVDKKAKEALNYAYENQKFHKHPNLPQEGFQLWMEKKKIHSHFKQEMRKHIGKQNLRKYLYGKQLISWNTFPLIDWDTLESFMNKQSREFKLWYTKHYTNFCGIGKMMKRMKLWSSDLCPCCQQIPENATTHMYICPHPLITNKRETLFKDILIWMEKVNTDPNIYHLFYSLWHGITPNFSKEESMELIKIWNILQDIGTASTWMGLFPTNLCELQDRYYKMMGLRSSGKKWGIDLTNKVLRATLSLWLQRNEIVHAQTKEGISGMEREVVFTKIEEELSKGIGGLQPEDFYLLDTNIDKLRGEPIESVRGWLCSVMIARGDLEGAKEEGLKDRGTISRCQPQLSEREMRRYLDWRNIHLKQ